MESARVVSGDDDLVSIETTLPTADAWPWSTDPPRPGRWWVPDGETDVRASRASCVSWPRSGWAPAGIHLDARSGAIGTKP
ncbi:MAG TPA: hypothetical protein VLD62_05785 [Acidimicrobiia bacterium]|nr:hypothetical protein [Acidimicrobiia bacterium]